MLIYKHLKYHLILAILTISNINFVAQQTNSKIDSTDYYFKLLKSANENSIINPDLSIAKFKRAYSYYQNIQDTTKQLWALISLSVVEKNTGRYSDSFDHLWESLLLCRNSQKPLNYIKINRGLGELYEIYNKTDQALKYTLTALQLSKQLNRDSAIYFALVTTGYFNTATLYRKAGKYDLALAYIDSCNIFAKEYDKTLFGRLYLMTEKGYIYLNQGRIAEAEAIFNKLEPQYQTKDKQHLAVFYSFAGELFAIKNNTEKAIYYYKKSLEAIDSVNTSTDIKPEILLRLSQLYEKQKNYPNAYAYLLQSKTISDALFNAKSGSNNELFEIKNKYIETIRTKDEYIKTLPH